MSVGRHTVVLFDAACLVAGAASPGGGSGFLLQVCSRGYLQGAVSRLITTEATRNVRDKLGDLATRRLEHLLNAGDLARILPVVFAREHLINEKDRHVLAVALAARAEFLLTLDRRFAAEVTEAGFGVKALTPGEFIRGDLMTHPEWPFAHH